MAHLAADNSSESLPVAMNNLRSAYDTVASYRMTQTSHQKKVRNVPTSGASADYHFASEWQYLQMVEYAREMRRNDPIVGTALKRLAANVVQDGFSPDPQLPDDAYMAARDWWNRFTDYPEIQREYSWNEVERAAFTAAVSDGDIVALPVEMDGEFCVQMVEGHLLRSPSGYNQNIVLGVELDQNRKRVAYHFAVDDTAPYRQVMSGSSRRYPAFDMFGDRLVFHVYFPDRFTQTRGVPAVQSVDDFIQYHDDTQFAHLVKQQVSANYAIFHQFEAGVPGITAQTANATQTQLPDGNYYDVDEAYPGKQYFGSPGESVQVISPNVPSPSYFEHVRMMLQIISINLDLPLQVLLLDPSQTNFSGWRGAMDQAKMRWRDMQREFCNRFHKRVYRALMSYAVTRDRTLARAERDGYDIYTTQWRMPTWPYIEPMTDVQSDIAQVDGRLNSARRILMSRNIDFDQLIPEIIADNAFTIRAAKQAAADINAEFDDGSPVEWHQVLSVPGQKGVTTTVSKSMSESIQEGTSGQQQP